MLRIRRAFCVELCRIVSIDEARLAFALSDRRFDAYRFVCAEPACKDRNVRISGVNYRVDAISGRKILENHFRRWDPHSPECMYAEGGLEVSEREETRAARFARGRMTPLGSDLVAVFHPGSARKRLAEKESSREHEVSRLPVLSLDESPEGIDPVGSARVRYAMDLAELVDTYREARLRLDASEFQKLMLRIVGHGTVGIGELFVPVRRARVTDRLQVIYGGAVLSRQYPRGFRLRFFDRIDGRPVFVYVPGESLRDSPGAEQVVERVRAMQGGGYSTTYVFGGLEAKPDGGSFSCVVLDLRHLVLRAPPRQRLLGSPGSSADPVSFATPDTAVCSDESDPAAETQ